MWPAVIFAASRKHKVIGRIMILRVSIIIRGGESHSGAPLGKRLADDIVGFFLNPEVIRESQRGNPIDNVKIKWDERLKVYGSNPIKLIIIVREKIEGRRNEKNFRWDPEVRIAWLNIEDLADKISHWRGEEDIQKVWEKIITGERQVSHSIRDINECRLEFDGSKIEKMSVIINFNSEPGIPI